MYEEHTKLQNTMLNKKRNTAKNQQKKSLSSDLYVIYRFSLAVQMKHIQKKYIILERRKWR